jgi:glycosyltransferase involved in cell wall biosynthesis
MRIVHLTPGTGSFHCGSCLRDHALIKALRVRKHDAIMVPLYLPLVTDGVPTNPEIGVQVGGVSLYIAEKTPWLAKIMPRFVHRWLNNPERLKKLSKRMGMTSAKSLGEMTLGSLLGTDGRQWSEWSQLIDWLKTEPKPDVISLSNSLLSGLAPTLKKAFPQTKIVVSMQGEDSFIDTLPEPYCQQSWEAMRKNADAVDCFIAPSRYYAGVMQQKIGFSDDRLAVVYNGIDVTPFPTADPDPNWPTIGYFARMIHGKGLTQVVDAFIQLAQRGTVPRLKLKVGGAYTLADEAYVAGLKKKLAEAGLAQRVEWHPNVSFQDKVRFFRDLTVFSVPANYGEAFGLYVVEAVASGVPVVQPAHGAFPEIVDRTQGGVLVPADDEAAYVNALEKMLTEHVTRENISRQGIPAARQHFSAHAMTDQFEQMLQECVAR